MLGNFVKYDDKFEESRQVEKIKKVLTEKLTEFLYSYYTVLDYGKSCSSGLLKSKQYRKR